MNLLLIKNNERKEPKETDQLDDSDCSDTWSLPNWQELNHARLYREKKMRRLRRLRAKEERAKQREEQKNAVNVEDPLLHAVSSSGSLATLDEEMEDDLPEDMKQRGQWNNSFEFLLSIISMSVGIGNFYRFPYVAYQNGGGAFLIPYILVLTFIGRPMYLLELAIGQFCSYGQVRVWSISPILRGVGYGSAIGSFCVVTYYSSVMGTVFYYLFQSFKKTLPWTVCDPEWAGRNVCEHVWNITKHNKSVQQQQIVNLPQLYYENKVQGEKDSIDDGIGIPQGMPTLCLFITWALICGIIVRGVESSGKAAYFTTLYPFAVIIIMLIVSCTKSGAGAGMLYFVTPQWSKMADPSVWFAAVGQCFFSLSIGFGPIINYASYNPFHHPIYRDVLVVSFMDTFASFIAGLTVFATLGAISHNMDKPIHDVIVNGPGLVFVAFSDAISNFAYVPQLAAVLFFTMLLTLGAGSSAALQMAVISVISDQFPKLSRIWITVSTCIFGFLVSLIYVTPGGQFMLTLVDNFGGNVNIFILAGLECIGIAWIYGLKNFVKDVEFMLNKRVNWYWKMCWGFIIPVCLTAVMLYSLITGKRLEHNGRPFPDSAIYCGWMITTISIIIVPIFSAITIYNLKGTFKQRFLASLRHTEEFGPRNPSDKERWELFKRGIIVEGGAGPDFYQLPEGVDVDDLPSWLTMLEDGTVLPRKTVDNDADLQALRRPKDDEFSINHQVEMDEYTQGLRSTRRLSPV